MFFMSCHGDFMCYVLIRAKSNFHHVDNNVIVLYSNPMKSHPHGLSNDC